MKYSCLYTNDESLMHCNNKECFLCKVLLCLYYFIHYSIAQIKLMLQCTCIIVKVIVQTYQKRKICLFSLILKTQKVLPI